MQSGFLVLDKPVGISSAKAIAIVKKKLALEKVGHAGTLDPMASGILVILINQATRLADFISAGTKIYSGIVRFGASTSTDDAEGELLEQTEKIPSFAEIQAALENFKGTIKQVPPQISALKVNGERAYRRSRRGEDFELAAREVTIDAFEIQPQSELEVRFRVICSKGTYVRSLARDLGETCGSLAHLAALKREASAPFSLANAADIDSVSKDHILPWYHPFESTPRIELSAESLGRLRQGNIIEQAQIAQRMQAQYPNHTGPAIALNQSGTPEAFLSFAEKTTRILVDGSRG